MIESTYLHPILSPRDFKKLINKAVKKLKGYKFSAIAVRGISGATVGATLAHKLGKNLLLVRKGESCHSDKNVEGNKNIRTYIVVDDFVSTGATLDEIINGIHKWNKAKCVGVYLYNEDHIDGNDRCEIEKRNLKKLY